MVDANTHVGKGATVGKDKEEDGKLTLVGGGLDIKPGISVPDGGLVNEKTLADIGEEAGAK
jgi:hypothetical protein